MYTIVIVLVLNCDSFVTSFVPISMTSFSFFRLRSDFDDPPNTKLIGAHGYCSQVNNNNY